MDALRTLQQLQQQIPNLPGIQDFRNYIAQLIAQQSVNEQTWVQSITFSAVAVAASQTQTLSVAADGAFQIQGAMAFYQNHASLTATTVSTRLFPLATLTLNNQSPGQGQGGPIQQEAFPIANLFGSNGVPFVFPTPITILPKGVLQGTITNNDNALTIDCTLTFIGKKLFNYQS